jgi:2-methylcitrate dehydratase PrpD
MSKSATDELIAFVHKLDLDRLPEDVIRQAKRCILDLLGVAIAGSQTRLAQVSTGYARDQFSPGDATLIGAPFRLCESGATWVNGVCASALDMDDGHRRAAGHPGAAVIPAALAVAEISAASGADFLTAVVAGYEVAIRVSVAMLPDYRAGRFSTGIWGAYGSVTAAGKLLKLDHRTFQDALGITGFHGPSPPGDSFMHESMVKETIGWAGMAGCAAAILAREGFAGPEDTLEKSKRYDTAELVKGLGQEAAILRTYFKPYASCRWSHPAIDGALHLASENGLMPDEIQEIHVAAFQPITMLCDYTPATTVAAQYSIPFSLALALRYGRIGPGELSESNLKDPELLELARKVRVSVDPDLDRLFPEQTAIRVELRTRQGVLSTRVEYPKGDPHNPLSDAELDEKFEWLTVDIMGADQSRQLREAIGHIEEMENIQDLRQLLLF